MLKPFSYCRKTFQKCKNIKSFCKTNLTIAHPYNTDMDGKRSFNQQKILKIRNESINKQSVIICLTQSKLRLCISLVFKHNFQ